jgi:hypothetical protein
VMSSALRDGPAVEGRRSARERLEVFPQALEPGVVEAGADLGDVDEAHGVGHAPVL